MQADCGFRLDVRWLFWGLTLGLLAGAGLSLWLSPRSGANFRAWASQGVRSRINEVAPPDPVAASMAEGKEAARKRKEGVA